MLSRRDELKLLWTTVHCHLGSKVTAKALANAVVPYVTPRTRWLLDRCEEQCLPSLEGYICEYWLRLEKTGWKVVWQPKKKIMKADPRNLPALLAMTCIH